MTVRLCFLRRENRRAHLVPGAPPYVVRVDLDAEPAPTVTTGGIGDSASSHWLEDDGNAVHTSHAPGAAKPPYRVPSMAEIEAMPANGLTVASTFSGCGGSCLGFRMAGFSVVWANEFTPAAQDSYRANASPDTFLDTRDIRQVNADDILGRTGLTVGELDVFEGSPPCTAFSTAGKGHKGWGEVKVGGDTGIRQRVDDLFFDYARLLEGLQPRAFVAENVTGLIRGTAKGYFKEILVRLRECGYRVEAKVLDAQWLGVPQYRQRLIFVGVRQDVGRTPAFPRPFPYRYSVRDALPELSAYRYDTGGQFGRRNKTVDVAWDVAPTISVSGGTAPRHHQVSGPEVHGTPGGYPEEDIDRYAIGREYDRLAPGESSGRYFNLKRASLERPSQTVTSRGGAAGVAAVTHPTERRKFTIAELRRICAFPDDFTLTGTYAQQWARLGNAVPPLMMRAVAEAIRDQVLA